MRETTLAYAVLSCSPAMNINDTCGHHSHASLTYLTNGGFSRNSLNLLVLHKGFAPSPHKTRRVLSILVTLPQTNCMRASHIPLPRGLGINTFLVGLTGPVIGSHSHPTRYHKLITTRFISFYYRALELLRQQPVIHLNLRESVR